MIKVKTQYTVLMEDFDAKIGKKQSGHQAVGEYMAFVVGIAEESY